MSRKSPQLLQLSITRTDPMVVFFESQVEYCYPPIDSQKTKTTEEVVTEDGNRCPETEGNENKTTVDQKSATDEPIVLPQIWKTLPSLALPDGSHNHERDAIYFHLPAVEDHNRTIYGVSCYRQISANVWISLSDSSAYYH